jgi:hypothetical protein
MAMRPVICSLALLAGLGTGAAAARAADAPASTLSCDGFFQLARGSWYAKPDNAPFDLGSKQGAVIRGRTVVPGQINVGGYDLAEVLNTRCRTAG